MDADAMKHGVSIVCLHFSCLFALTDAAQLVRHRMRRFITMRTVSQVWYQVSAIAVLSYRRKYVWLLLPVSFKYVASSPSLPTPSSSVPSLALIFPPPPPATPP